MARPTDEEFAKMYELARVPGKYYGDIVVLRDPGSGELYVRSVQYGRGYVACDSRDLGLTIISALVEDAYRKVVDE